MELIREAQTSYPQDEFFSRIEEMLDSSPKARAIYSNYDTALSYLDHDSWRELSQKALAHFLDHRQGQWKQGFFNQINEAFAYQYLVRQSHTNVRILREGRTTTPDIAYCAGSAPRHCEVKSMTSPKTKSRIACLTSTSIAATTLS